MNIIETPTKTTYGFGDSFKKVSKESDIDMQHGDFLTILEEVERSNGGKEWVCLRLMSVSKGIITEVAKKGYFNDPHAGEHHEFRSGDFDRFKQYVNF